MKRIRKVLADGTVRYYNYNPKCHLAGPEPESLGALIAAWKRSPEWRALKPATVKNYSIYLRELEALADQPVAEIKRKILLGMRDALAECRGNGAANVFMRVCTTLFAWAVEREWVPYSPVARVKQLPGGHRAAWTAAEADRAAQSLPEELRRAVILGRYTGQRRGDLCAMTWAQYDGAYISVVQEKTKQGQEKRLLAIPCHPVLRAELAAWKATTTSTHILTNSWGKPWAKNYLTQRMDAELARIGLRGELNVHGLRKLAATELAEAGCSAHEVAAVTGHRTLAMVQLYTASAEQKRLATAAIVRLADHR